MQPVWGQPQGWSADPLPQQRVDHVGHPRHHSQASQQAMAFQQGMPIPSSSTGFTQVGTALGAEGYQNSRGYSQGNGGLVPGIVDGGFGMGSSPSPTHQSHAMFVDRGQFHVAEPLFGPTSTEVALQQLQRLANALTARRLVAMAMILGAIQLLLSAQTEYDGLVGEEYGEAEDATILLGDPLARQARSEEQVYGGDFALGNGADSAELTSVMGSLSMLDSTVGFHVIVMSVGVIGFAVYLLSSLVCRASRRRNSLIGSFLRKHIWLAQLFSLNLGHEYYGQHAQNLQQWEPQQQHPMAMSTANGSQHFVAQNGGFNPNRLQQVPMALSQLMANSQHLIQHANAGSAFASQGDHGRYHLEQGPTRSMQKQISDPLSTLSLSTRNEAVVNDSSMGNSYLLERSTSVPQTNYQQTQFNSHSTLGKSSSSFGSAPCASDGNGPTPGAGGSDLSRDIQAAQQAQQRLQVLRSRLASMESTLADTAPRF
mmetsp:Transcript_6082/g.22307  ORF Transcript_6082/g.22307 Transcript_6082/m.22307 type:complete len:484 (-) Transcript_6082:6264-7715(-)